MDSKPASGAYRQIGAIYPHISVNRSVVYPKARRTLGLTANRKNLVSIPPLVLPYTLGRASSRTLTLVDIDGVGRMTFV